MLAKLRTKQGLENVLEETYIAPVPCVLSGAIKVVTVRSAATHLSWSGHTGSFSGRVNNWNTLSVAEVNMWNK